MLRRLYDWVLSWSASRYATPALFVLAFAESSFFPIPPDVLLIALAFSLPTRAFRYALVCSLGSVLGGVAGYGIGWGAAPLGHAILDVLHASKYVAIVGQKYEANAFAAILLAAFTPIPYKVFTIAAGFWHEQVPLSTLVLASAIGRPARFYLVALLIRSFGPRIRPFIERWFGWLTVAVAAAVILGFAALRFLT